MQKGFDTARIREHFTVLRSSRMLLHGYFILGNIGESLQDMEQILPFARELGLDTIALSTLRVSPHSGLDELVAASPGYHVEPGGKVFSDACSVADLRNLRRRIYREFFNLPQMLKVLRKGLKMGWVGLLPGLLPRLPRIAWHVAAHRRRRFKRHAQERVRRPTLAS
jgi:hypothetical protein